MHSRYVASLLMLGLAGSPLIGSEPPQQARSDETRNLQYFPKGTKRSELIPQMRQFAFALGVACTHCHGTEEQTGFNLRGVDFSLDIKPTKTQAREMLRMVDEINSNVLSKISSRSDLNLEVSCFTCHSGAVLPEMIEARVGRTIEAQGIEAAVEDYRTLREKYYGSAAYNFREQPLVEVTSDLLRSKKYVAAAAISQLNLEFHPDSGQSKFGLAEAYAALGEKEKARSLFEELLKARPNDRRLMQRLEALDKQEN